ncbi:excalibur calcium-binding domain-containing protein [Streptomyces sp. NPDC048639]|uniref:excalibur calcium-binding domain-containing protein n=1 Tax=Streptomyces sp. NPDC048639 TaxID=3365581 RepID=UPI0037238F28
MSNPYQIPATPRTAPKWARKRFVLPGLCLAFFIGIGAGASGNTRTDTAPVTDSPLPKATVTATVTETATATPEPEPATTVTVRASRTVRTTPTAEPAYGSGGSSTGGSSVYYLNCSAARAAGAAPVHVGDPGYGRHLDRDGDGTGCDWG